MAYKECYLSTKKPCINSDSGITFFSDKSSDVDAFLLKNFKIITTYTNTIIVNDQI